MKRISCLLLALSFLLLGGCRGGNPENSSSEAVSVPEAVSSQVASSETKDEMSEKEERIPVMESLKILFIGSSFSEDTTGWAAEIAKSLGVREVLISTLYIGGCPINKHYENFAEEYPEYRYEWNDGSGWKFTDGFTYRSTDAVKEQEWDWIVIQHGSSYGGSYIEDESYADLQALVSGVKAIASPKTRIAFNLTWTGDDTCTREPLEGFGGDRGLYFKAICERTQRLVVSVSGMDKVIPSGTAVLNARTTELSPRMHRDGYHLSYGVGRYLASLTLLCALTDLPIEDVTFMPDGVTKEDRAIVLKAISAAMQTPYDITTIF